MLTLRESEVVSCSCGRLCSSVALEKKAKPIGVHNICRPDPD